MAAHLWALVAAVIAFHLGLDLIAPRLFHPDHDFAAAFAVGLVIGQLNLVAIWSALATGKIIVRLPWAAFLALLMWYALVLGNRYVDRWNASDAIFLGIVLLSGALLTQPALWIARLKFGWRLFPPGMRVASLSQAEDQFSLGQLLVGVALVGLAVGLGRLALPPGEVTLPGVHGDLLVIVPVAAMVNLIVTAPCIWMAFARFPMLYVWAVGWIVYAFVVGAIEVQVLVVFLGPPGDDVLMIAWAVNLTQCGTVLGTLLVLRAMGFELSCTQHPLEVSTSSDQNNKGQDDS